jgi:hypothetical protein
VLEHLRTTIRNEEWDLLFEQLISEHTKTWFRDNGREPRDAVDIIEDNADAVLSFLSTVPMGVSTPGAQFDSAPGRAYVLKPPGYEWTDQRFTRLTMRIENNRFVLDGIRSHRQTVDPSRIPPRAPR